jgi:hypothetical protein
MTGLKMKYHKNLIIGSNMLASGECILDSIVLY